MHDPMRKRGEGSVSKHRCPDGSIKYRARIVAAGKRHSLGLSDTEEEAHDRVRAAMLELRGERDWTLRRFAKKWLDDREVIDRVRGIDQERSCWHAHVEPAPFYDLPMRSITRRMVLRWVKSLQEKRATVVSPGGERIETERRLSRDVIGRALSLLRCCLRAAADEELIETNPAADVRPPKGEEREVPWTFLTLEEIDAVLSLRLRAEQRAIFTVAVFAGLRGGELWGLRWCDVHLDGDRCELVVCRSYRNATKSKRIRRVPLLPPALAALKTWRKLRPGVGEALVFPAASGGCHYRAFDAGWESAKRRAGIVRPVRFHDLRHTCASHLVMGSWTERPLRLEECRVWMGHSTIRVTERYSHLCPDWLHSLATPQNHEGIANLKKS